MNQKQFLQEFRNEHRIIRDNLMDIITSLIRKDIAKSKALLLNLNAFTGPHFRYEEEVLYPALVNIYGAAYINKLYTDHDMAIARAKRLNSIFGQCDIQDIDYTSAIMDVKAILPHVSDCEGLSIMVERFDDHVVKKLSTAQKNSWKNNLSLFEWSETCRNRKQLHFN